jgi:hypothetical protein
LSLEKWLKPKKKGEKSVDKKSKDVKKKEKRQINKDSTIEISSKSHTSVAINITKFKLECTKNTCKYQKTIIKKNLADKDKICPRCKSKMKIK